MPDRPDSSSPAAPGVFVFGELSPDEAGCLCRGDTIVLLRPKT